MSLQEKKMAAFIAGSITCFALYCLLIYHIYNGLNPGPQKLLVFWGAVILIMIPVQIIPKVLINTIFSLINRFSQNNYAPLSDDLVRVIELKTLKIGYMVFVAGFLLAMLPLLMGSPVSYMFIILLISMAASCIFTDLSALFLYKKALSQH